MIMTNSPYPGAVVLMVWEALKFHATYIGLGILAVVGAVLWALGVDFDYIKIFGPALAVGWVLLVGLALYIEANAHHISIEKKDGS